MTESNIPFYHLIIDNFFEQEMADKLSDEFIDYNDERWFYYNNVIENKKTLNDWRFLPKHVYQAFTQFCSDEFVKKLQDMTGIEKLYPDYGLHGGGCHMHGRNGKLNIHRDYSVHPKLGLERKLNLIVYLSKDWDNLWGGGLELWSHDTKNNQPKEKVKEVECVYNRAVLFDTTQNSWHGLPEPLRCPESVYRKSLAMYYMTNPSVNVDPRQRALFAPTKNQKNDIEVKKFIEERTKLS
jgi:Rps23 Pro-64 3,4-dihydroxylase Tpa1-like proline 4-hydroxylase